MFDIDGTLTESNTVDDASYLQALAEVLGFTDVDGDWSQYPHCTDEGILAHLFQTRLQRPPRTEEIAAVRNCFVELIGRSAEAAPLRMIAGAAEFMAKLAAEPGYRVALASGGWERSARLKLASAKLDCREIPAAFADDGHSREAIMQSALARAKSQFGVPHFTRCTYIGDGIWDARAARQLGYRFIGIARDDAKRQRLVDAGALAVFADYRDAEQMWQVLVSE